MTDREMIEAVCGEKALPIEGWDEDADNGLTANLGQWAVYHDDYSDDEHALYIGDKGVLTATVVGAEQYGNRRVSFLFTPKGMDGGNEVPEGDPHCVLEPVAA